MDCKVIMMESRIPTFGRPNKKIRLSGGEMLRDVTNTPVISGRSATVDGGKLAYGDDKLMEEIKRRERKVLQDINRLKSAVEEIDKETEKIRSRLPELAGSYRQLLDNIDNEDKQILCLEEQLESLESQCNNERENQRRMVENLELQHSIDVTNHNTSLDQKNSESRHNWEVQLIELQNEPETKDNVDIIKAIKTELAELQVEWYAIEKENDKKCSEYKQELREQFETFRREKKLNLQETENTANSSLKDENELRSKLESHKASICANDSEIANLRDTIADRTSTISQIDKSMLPLEQELREASLQFREIENDCNHVNKVCEHLKSTNSLVFERYLQEKRAKKKLQYAIEEIRGKIRNFAILNSDRVKNIFDVDITKATIRNINNRRVYQFNRLIERESIQEQRKLWEEFETYIEIQLRKQCDFSIFICNPAATEFPFVDKLDTCISESTITDAYTYTRTKDGSMNVFNFKSKIDGSEVIGYFIELREDIRDKLENKYSQTLSSTIPCIMHLLDISTISISLQIFQTFKEINNPKPSALRKK